MTVWRPGTNSQHATGSRPRVVQYPPQGFGWFGALPKAESLTQWEISQSSCQHAQHLRPAKTGQTYMEVSNSSAYPKSSKLRQVMKLMVTWGSTILRTPLLKNPGRATVPRALMLGVPQWPGSSTNLGSGKSTAIREGHRGGLATSLTIDVWRFLDEFWMSFGWFLDDVWCFWWFLDDFGCFWWFLNDFGCFWWFLNDFGCFWMIFGWCLDDVMFDDFWMFLKNLRALTICPNGTLDIVHSCRAAREAP